MSVGRKMSDCDPSFATAIPDEVGLQLTNRCNLRCKHCFQWNPDGFHHNMDHSVRNCDLSIDVAERIMRETASVKSNLYLWGGEPLSYGDLPALSKMIEKDPRWTVFCTNGIEVEKNIESLLRMSSSLAMLVSVEGFERENDSVRGHGTFEKVMRSIKHLLELKRKGEFFGEISVNCVISEQMIGRMFEFALMFEEIGINSLYFCFPWYIPENTADEMDQFFREHFSWLRTWDDAYVPSWHSYTYRLPASSIEPLIADIRRLSSREWKIRMRLQPALGEDEIEEFVTGQGNPGQRRKKCIGIRNRMNVLPDGKVTVCKIFPEFEIGDLNTNSVSEVWNSEGFNRARAMLNCGLMPVCAKCILLYLHGV